MSRPTDRQRERRAARLLRAYPASWRARYGDEFTQLLVDEMGDGEASLRRRADVVAHGLWTRLRAGGPAGSVALGSGAFALCATAIWAQLGVGWQWTAPTDAHTRAAMDLMSAGLLGAGAALLLTGGVLLSSLVRGAPVSRAGVLVLVLCGIALGAGAAHVGAAWPGTGGHRWAGRGLVPAWPARMAWALTLSLSSYWAHPAALGALGDRLLGWMVVSPLLFAAFVWAARRLACEVRLSGRRLLTARILGRFGAGGMGVFLIGALVWAFGSSPGPHGLYAPGVIDAGLVLLSGGGLLCAVHALRRPRLHTGPR